MKKPFEIVEKIAALAKLKFNEEERERYAKKFHAVLCYIETLSEIDTETTSRTGLAQADVGACTTGLRDDHVVASTHARDILNLAPEKEGAYFLVPKVIDS